MTEIRLLPLSSWQQGAIRNPYTHFAMFGGVASLKTATGAHFVIEQILKHPHLTGLVGANDYNQLSAVALRELFQRFDEYGFEYVIDRMPPAHWGMKRKFKSYANVLSVRRWDGECTTIFTRILSDPNALRGITISWYWIDETRDSKKEAHDVLLGRLRESNYIRGLITTTTNGYDWVYERFVQNYPGKGSLYGSMHVPTYESVKIGIISEEFYKGLLASYSPLMADQEVFAKHVNVKSGRAYYAAQESKNAMSVAPWGDEFPDRARPLIVGCDFNFTPAPCVWVYGQTGPGEWSRHVHWFGELSNVEVSTETMTQSLIMQLPEFFYQVFGDASGNRGTTSNAGETDYARMSGVFEENGCPYAIDSDQANPLVKDRVESVNAMLLNALGEVRMTYNKDTCPLLHSDFMGVGWSESGKLKGQNVNQTHASDGAGYAIFKLFGPHSVAILEPSVPSAIRE